MLQQDAEQNRFLRALPFATYERLSAGFEPVDLEVNYELWSQSTPIEWVYFPRSCVGSVLVQLEENTAVEAATIGREGIVGSAVIMGAMSSGNTRAIAQVAGAAVRIRAEAFRTALADDSNLLRNALRSAHALQEQTAQSVACNARHTLEERCARWLLMTHDRVGRDEFQLLQTFLAFMLGVHRPRVTVVAGLLQRAKLIDYQRGRITITNRVGLEAASCECYEIVRRLQDESLAAMT